MEGVHGLPNPRAMSHPSRALDDRRPSHHHFDAPPTPLSAGMLFQPTQATIALHARLQHEVQGFNDLVNEANRSAGEAKHYKTQHNSAVENWNAAIEDISTITKEKNDEISLQKRLTQEALNRSTESFDRVGELEQDKEDLGTSVGFLQAQIGALEDEKNSLQSDLDGKQASWQTEEASWQAQRTSWQTETESLAADKVNAEETLADQRKKRVEVENARDSLQEEVTTYKTKLDGMEVESKAAAEKLQAAQREVTDVQTELTESTREIDRLKKRITALDKDREDLKEEHNKTLKEALDTNTTMRTEHDKKITRMDGLVEEANKSKTSMETNLSRAQIGAGQIKNTLDKTRKSLQSLEEKHRELESVCRKTGRERDAADEDKSKLADQVAGLKAEQKELRLRFEGLEQALEVERKIADSAREFWDRLNPQKNTPKVGDGSAKEPVDKKEDRKAESTPLTPSKPSSSISKFDTAAKNPPTSGHITPPDNDAALPRSDDKAQEPCGERDHSPTSAGPSASTTSDSQPAKEISITLPGRTSKNASLPNPKSPLTKSTTVSSLAEPKSGYILVPTGPKESNYKGNNRKRRRDEEATLDPRLPKRPSSMGRRDTCVNDRYGGRRHFRGSGW